MYCINTVLFNSILYHPPWKNKEFPCSILIFHILSQEMLLCNFCHKKLHFAGDFDFLIHRYHLAKIIGIS